MSDQDNHTKNAFLGVALGLLVGYAAGVLSAPKSGKETRQDIADVGAKFVHQAGDTIDNLQDQLNDLINLAKDQVSTLNDRRKEELEKLVHTAKDASDKANSIYSAVKEGKADDPDLKKAVENFKKAKNHLATFLAND